MEAVSAVKMRRSVGIAVQARPYALSTLHILQEIRKTLGDNGDILPTLLAKRPIKTSAVVVISSDKGLAGSFNTSVFREAEKVLKQKLNTSYIIAVGKKARDYFEHRQMLKKGFVGAGDYGTLSETKPIAEYILKEFISGAADEVVIIYTNFISALRQEVISRTLLPLQYETLKQSVSDIIPERGKYANVPRFFTEKEEKKNTSEILFEPRGEKLLEKLLPALLEIEVHNAILEANASEHSSRMVAMKSASDNAGDLIDTLSILYNKPRQATITKELAEITGGREALES